MSAVNLNGPIEDQLFFVVAIYGVLQAAASLNTHCFKREPKEIFVKDCYLELKRFQDGHWSVQKDDLLNRM